MKKLIDVDEKAYQFDDRAFSDALKIYCRKQRENGNRVTIASVVELIADNTHLTADAIRKWQYGYNGPSDIAMLKAAAEIISVDYHSLLEPLSNSEERGNQMINEMKDLHIEIGKSEKENLIGIINIMQELISEFGKSRCFFQIPETSTSAKDAEEYYLNRTNQLVVCINKLAFYISPENYRALNQLEQETMSIVCNHCSPMRWTEINPCFEIADFTLYEDIFEYSYAEVLGDHPYEFEVEESTLDVLKKDTEAYQRGIGEMLFTDMYNVIGMRIGNWFMDVVRHDFPSLFM